MYKEVDENENKALELHSIHKKLEEIRLYLEKEVGIKQITIEQKDEQITHLKILSEEKNALIGKLENQLMECRQTYEGTRQLINKLLNDISNYQKDIEWYKRTYQDRSLWGYLKERLKK